MSFGKTEGTKSYPVINETWLPGQKEYIPQYANVWKDIFAGNLESPTTKMLQQITGEAAMRETAQERRRVSGTRGLTAPAKAKALKSVGEVGVSAMAKVPQDVWGQAKEFLSAYSLTPPTVTSAQYTKGGGGYNFGLCWVWTFFDGRNGEATKAVREFRDACYGRGSKIAVGYQLLGLFIRPLLRFWLIRKIIFWSLYSPITKIAKGERNPLIMMIGHFWKFVFEITERVGKGYAYKLYNPNNRERSQPIARLT